MTQFELEDSIIEIIDSNDFDTALDYIEDYRLEFGETQFYFFSLSDVYLGLEQYDSALDIMHDAIKKGIDNDLVYERLGDAYYGLEDYSSALDWYLRCNLNQDDPNLMHTIYMIALCYLCLDQYQDSINYFEDFLLEQESDDAYFNCAIAYLHVGNVSRALDYFKKTIDNEDLIMGASMETLRLGYFEEAEYLFSLLEDVPTYLLDIWKSAYYECQDDYSNAIFYTRKALEQKSTDTLKADLAVLLENDNQLDEANAIYQEILDNDIVMDDNLDDYVDAHLVALNIVKDSEVKIYYLTKLEEYAQNYPDIYVKMMNYALKNDLKDYQDHLLYDVSTIDTNDLKQEIYMDYLAVGVHLSHDRFEDALSVLKSIKCEKGKFYYKQLLLCFYHLKRYDEAIQLYDKIMPDGESAVIFLECFIELNDIEGFHKLLDDMDIEQSDNIEDSDVFYDMLQSIFDGIDTE